jgi:hypothetical protein
VNNCQGANLIIPLECSPKLQDDPLQQKKTWVKVGEAIWDFMQERVNKPRPRIKFPPKSSGKMFLMFDAFTLLTNR